VAIVGKAFSGASGMRFCISSVAGLPRRCSDLPFMSLSFVEPCTFVPAGLRLVMAGHQAAAFHARPRARPFVWREQVDAVTAPPGKH